MPLTAKFLRIYKGAAERSPEFERIVATFGREVPPNRNLQGCGVLKENRERGWILVVLDRLPDVMASLALAQAHPARLCDQSSENRAVTGDTLGSTSNLNRANA